MDKLAAHIASVLDTLLDDGFVLPIHVAGLGRNGAAVVLTYNQNGDDVVPSFTLDPTGPMAIPINLMFTDARGEAARVVIDGSGLRLNS